MCVLAERDNGGACPVATPGQPQIGLGEPGNCLSITHGQAEPRELLARDERLKARVWCALDAAGQRELRRYCTGEALEKMAINGSGTNGSQNHLPARINGSAQSGPKPLCRHRIRTVRRQQGMSLRTAARQLGLSTREVLVQEDETCDLRLSDLLRWQAVLDVPLLELLVEPDMPLSRPILHRAQLVRLMKTAAAILECATAPRVRRLAENLVDQLTEWMPELKGVAAWHSVGQRRTGDEYGRILERPVSDEMFSEALAESLD